MSGGSLLLLNKCESGTLAQVVLCLLVCCAYGFPSNRVYL